MITRQRTQTGVRLESSLLKVLKGLAEYKDLSLSDLLEGILLHALENKPAFADDTLAAIAQLKRIYGCDLDSTHAHRIADGQAGS
ncbi:MAG: hypothetical protein KDA49_08680 [Rhodospirillaceae bacterium]|nr:hypothetical protein [Rhodospirillaceae bacterium]MCA8932529.1 hypothetical protein [Rhodospirillaceae bacterium]